MGTVNTAASLIADLAALGLQRGMMVMVHSSLSRVGWTEGGPLTVIQALLEVLGRNGTLVMPAESPQLSDPNSQDLFDPQTTSTTMGRDSRSLSLPSRHAPQQSPARFRLRQRPPCAADHR
jgi:aminoglycoside N3'-acetyltransferase